MTKIFAVANQKGGVAKTTTTFNLSAALALKGHSVLMIDLDPQASLTISAGFEPGNGEAEKNVCELFQKRPDSAGCAFSIQDQIFHEKLFLIASDIDLAEVENKLFTRMSRESVLKKSLEKLTEYFEYIFIDCPPQLSLLTTNALVAADEVIIPAKTEYLSYRGLKGLYSTINEIRDGINEKLEITGIIATLYEKSIKDQRDILDIYTERYNVLGVVRKGAATYKDIIEGLPVVVTQPKSDMAQSYINISSKII